jgi:hypothetical protein
MAGMLRRFAEEHTGDNYHEMFLGTAAALEERAHLLADGQESAEPEQGQALHAPVNMMV